MTPATHDNLATSGDPGPATGLHTFRRGAGPPLVLAHGFTQTGRVWGGLDDELARDHSLVQVDLPGHGRSALVTVDLWAGAALLGAAGGVGDYLGYSMGARFALHLALERPDVVRRLVLVSGTAGLDSEDERARRRAADEALADRLQPLGGGPATDTVDEFVARWVTAPLFGVVPTAAQGLEQRRTNTAAGLASSLRLAGTGTMTPLWDRLPGLSMPVLMVTGARDEKFSALGRRLVDAIGGPVEHVTVPDADHAPHLQRPDVVAGAVRAFLADPAPV